MTRGLYDRPDRIKKKFREQAMRTRDIVARETGDTSGGLIRYFPASLLPDELGVVSGFSPIGSEIDALPLLAKLRKKGHESALPIVVANGEPLVFRRWAPGDDMTSGPFGVQEPLPSASEVVPDILLVPLLAFDRRGYRLGYGGGFYDRTLERLRANGRGIAVGVAFAGQEVNAVPVAAYDQPLNWIVTEREAIEIGA
jgi:5-formyltetrahydrofolate cyclo-ligase